MMSKKHFFYLKDISTLVEEATKAGGTDLGIVVTTDDEKGEKPGLQVSFIKIQAGKSLADAIEEITSSVEGCPYPPRCQ